MNTATAALGNSVEMASNSTPSLFASPAMLNGMDTTRFLLDAEIMLELVAIMLTLLYVARLIWNEVALIRAMNAPQGRSFRARSMISGMMCRRVTDSGSLASSESLVTRILSAPVRSLIGVGALISLPKRSLRSQRLH